MKCHRSYLIADFENFSPDTLKIGDILRYGILYGNISIFRDSVIDYSFYRNNDHYETLSL